MKKHYINSNTSEHTESATIAMMWYRTGKTVQVNTYTEKGLVNVVHVHGAAQPKKKDENFAHCLYISQQLDLYANGLVYRCPECNECFEVPVNWSGEKYQCPHCHTVHDGDDLNSDGSQLWIGDYFEDVLDIEYIVGSDKEYRHVCLLVAYGGPNIYINTRTRQVELYWWNESATCGILRDTAIEIDEYFEEIYNG